MRHIDVSGTPRELGRGQGEEFREFIPELLEARLENAHAQALQYKKKDYPRAEIIEVAERCLAQLRRHEPDTAAELDGIAEGAQLSSGEIWAMNGLTDLRDVLGFGDPDAEPDEGCSSFLLPALRAANGHAWCGQTWDLATDNQRFVCTVRREPKEGVPTRAFTTVGCLSLIGMNDEGLAVGTTNIRTIDARPGLGYLDLIHSALTHERTAAAASIRIASRPRAGAHYFYLSDASDARIALECTARDSAELEVSPEALFVHCNHILYPAFAELEAQTPAGSSRARHERLEHCLLGDAVTLADFKAALADHENDTRAICRHDYDGISSNGSVVMCPATREFHVVEGPACKGTWAALS